MNKIRELREKNNIKLVELADALNINKGNLSSMETKGMYLTLENAKMIADFFGVSVDYLIGFSDDPILKKEILYMQKKETPVKLTLNEILELIQNKTVLFKYTDNEIIITIIDTQEKLVFEKVKQAI